MKKLIGLLILILGFVSLNAQIVYEPGYFINNSGEKVDCLIKDRDWSVNPLNFKYKLTESSDELSLNIKDVKEFAISNISKYVRSTVRIDTSTENANRYSRKREPEYFEKEVFLKVLVEGKANLYSYKERKVNNLFYSVNGDIIELLVYKHYILKSNQVAENNTYKYQILNKMKCETITEKSLEYLHYYEKDLTKLFIKYNECKDASYVIYKRERKKIPLHLRIKAGANYSSLNVETFNAGALFVDFGDKITFKAGFELEYVFPFNKNKWSVILDPSFHYFSAEDNTDGINSTVDYKSIDIPLGIRHSFYLNDKSVLYLTGLVNINFSLNSEIVTSKYSEVVDIASRNFNLGFSIGYKYNNNYSLEINYNTKRGLLNNHSGWVSDYQVYSLSLAYRIF